MSILEATMIYEAWLILFLYLVIKMCPKLTSTYMRRIYEQASYICSI